MKKLCKKLMIVGLAVLMLSAVFPTEIFALPPFEEATIIKDSVNMRLRPDTESPVILKFDKGTRIGVFEEETDGWLRIIYGNYRGYVSKEFVFLPSTDTVAANALVDNLELKLSPGDFSTAVSQVNAGEGVTIKDYNGDWCLVETLEGETGYVALNLIKESSSKTASSLLKKGMNGAEVSKAQRELRSRGFFGGSITGLFGDETEAAVISFQKKAKLPADGIMGEKTLDILYGDNSIKTTAAEKAGIKSKVTMPTWDQVANSSMKKGTYFNITDVRTGISFKAYRFGGWWHADSEPVTKADSAKMKKIFGGKWSWDRRAVWVSVGGKTYAASIHGMPHLADPIKGNDFPGHFCVHFYKSKVHQTGKACPRHQASVRYAYNRGNA